MDSGIVCVRICVARSVFSCIYVLPQAHDVDTGDQVRIVLDDTGAHGGRVNAW